MLVNKQTGFTLVEMAVVLVIVGLLVGSFIGSLVGRIEATRRDKTETELSDIKQVLMAYAFTTANPLLPRPDTSSPPDGLQDRVDDGFGSSTCAPYDNLNPIFVQMGVIPWRDLGLGREDAWGTHYRYWVSRVYASEAGFNLASSDFGSGNALIETRSNDVINSMVNNAVAVVFSHGKNRLGGINVSGIDQDAIPVADRDDENENGDGGPIFVSRPPTEEGATAAGGVFDDVLIWINSYELKAKMVEAGALP